MKQRQAVTKVTAKRYRQASRSEKKQMLDEFCRTTGYNRCYARWVLRHQGQRLIVGDGVALEAEVQRRRQRIKPRTYDQKVQRALVQIWELLDYVCGKRLVAILPEIIVKLEEFDELHLDEESRTKLMRVSAATADRLLQPERRKHELKGRGHTRAGTLLKHQIPIRTFAEWDEGKPGFVEIDLVAHDGGMAIGDFAQTLDLTDICTGWTETIAVPNKAQVWVFEAIAKARGRLPFPLLGIDSDNGSEFINHELWRYCIKEGISFTRSRPYRKNDNCYVEQKNYSMVRRKVGYQRFDTPAEGLLLNQLYDQLRLFTNFFEPTMRLQSKERLGSRVKKRYDAPRTPYQRVLASPEVTEANKEALRRQYQQLNPAALHRQLRKLQKQLFALAAAKPRKALRRTRHGDHKVWIKPLPSM